MRRLRKASRDDTYVSQRDYQTITNRKSALITFLKPAERNSIVLAERTIPQRAKFAGFGAYVKPSASTTLRSTLIAGDTELCSQSLELGTNWNRVGLVVENPSGSKLEVRLEFQPGVDKCSVWGVMIGPVRFPGSKTERNVSLAELASDFICPETLYLAQDTALDLVPDAGASSLFSLSAEGDEVEVKKCAYCQRELPLDSNRPGTLAFHKHNAKRTSHQNECRACKKWRINDDFNPKRTVDQLHESSAITRERKLMLREPEILQRIKDRAGGAGLKSTIWIRFGERCFWCGKPLKLREVQLDHTRPLAYLWPIDEHATCLCAVHNNLKKDKFPRDVYSHEQLRALSRITGLSLRELMERDVNEPELSRIIGNIAEFARRWKPRTFNAVARKVKDVRPEVDLFNTLEEADPTLYVKVLSGVRARPA